MHGGALLPWILAALAALGFWTGHSFWAAVAGLLLVVRLALGRPNQGGETQPTSNEPPPRPVPEAPALTPEEIEEENRLFQVIAQFHRDLENGWWVEELAQVGRDAEQLAVIAPKSTMESESLARLGLALRHWQDATPYVHHIWGLRDLEVGNVPRTPPILLAVPHSAKNIHEAYEPVALVCVVPGTDLSEAFGSLTLHLEEFRDELAWFSDPDSYSFYQR